MIDRLVLIVVNYVLLLGGTLRWEAQLSEQCPVIMLHRQYLVCLILVVIRMLLALVVLIFLITPYLVLQVQVYLRLVLIYRCLVLGLIVALIVSLMILWQIIIIFLASGIRLVRLMGRIHHRLYKQNLGCYLIHLQQKHLLMLCSLALIKEKLVY